MVKPITRKCFQKNAKTFPNKKKEKRYINNDLKISSDDSKEKEVSNEKDDTIKFTWD